MFNPVLMSVLVMVLLCLVKVNVLISLMVAALVAGVLGGLGLQGTMEVLIHGMGGNAETALSYILLGTLAVAISRTNIMHIVSARLHKKGSLKLWIFVPLLAFMGSFSQNLIPIHIAYIPILVPPLLVLMSKAKMDRRAVACALTFSVKWPYVTFPVGFGLIFHGIIARSMAQNGLAIEKMNVWKAMWLPGLGMLFGLFFAIFVSYRKPREYTIIEDSANNDETLSFGYREWITIIAVLVAFVVQLSLGSLPLGGLFALLILILSGVLRLETVDEVMAGGIKLMGFIAFVMLVAAGFAEVIKASNGVDALVVASTQLIGNSKLIGIIIMLLIGLVITMGIGTSFGTIPILATIYVPLGMKLGFSALAIACLLGTAGALGDAGSPASDSTLGPTAGLNADGQHNHIWDTCVPTFLHYSIPLFIFGLIGTMMF